jgi:hypothetical protein
MLSFYYRLNVDRTCALKTTELCNKTALQELVILPTFTNKNALYFHRNSYITTFFGITVVQNSKLLTFTRVAQGAQ